MTIDRDKLRALAEANLSVPHLAESERVILALLDAERDAVERAERAEAALSCEATARAELAEKERDEAVATFIDGHSTRLAESVGEKWAGLDDEDRDWWASQVHDVLSGLDAFAEGGERRVVDGRAGDRPCDHYARGFDDGKWIDSDGRVAAAVEAISAWLDGLGDRVKSLPDGTTPLRAHWYRDISCDIRAGAWRAHLPGETGGVDGEG